MKERLLIFYNKIRHEKPTEFWSIRRFDSLCLQFRQALVDLDKPVMEIHMSDINKTGVNKKVNILEDVRVGQVTGLKEASYYEGLRQLVNFIKNMTLQQVQVMVSNVEP